MYATQYLVGRLVFVFIKSDLMYWKGGVVFQHDQGNRLVNSTPTIVPYIILDIEVMESSNNNMRFNIFCCMF